eukprot:2982755-Alexandrium_andersonii.AAC.1
MASHPFWQTSNDACCTTSESSPGQGMVLDAQEQCQALVELVEIVQSGCLGALQDGPPEVPELPEDRGHEA